MDNEGIWEGLANGTFTVFSSDHAPYNYHDEKGKQVSSRKRSADDSSDSSTILLRTLAAM